MPTPIAALRRGLSRNREIKIAVTGRKSGREIAVVLWFVWENEKLYLLPGTGSETQWYKNLRGRPRLRVKAGGAEAAFTAVPLTDGAEVAAVIEKFRAKYGEDGIGLYGTLDVAVVAELEP